jgi:hypothetical protein
LTRNSPSASHPPPTRTITVERRIRIRRSFWFSPNCTIKLQKDQYNREGQDLFTGFFTRYWPSVTW